MRVVIVDDHWAIRDGLRWALEDSAEVDVVGDAASADEMFKLLATTQVDVVVLDIQMPDVSGLDALEMLKARHPTTKAVMLSMHDEPMFIRKALELGADGYVLKSAGADEILRALSTIETGGIHVQGEAARALAVDNPPEADSAASLSPRELEILQLVADGLENKQIARALGISETTVKTHLRSAFHRLDATSRSEAVATALRINLID